MNKKTYFKLYFSFLIFVFLVFIIPIVFINTIGYLCLGLARPIMFVSKIIDLFIFIGISLVIDFVVIFIIWLITRTIKKDEKFIRTINGLEFDKSNIIQIRKKKFGLMILTTFELNNYKNIHYFFNSEDDLCMWLENNNLIDLLVEKEYTFNKLKFWIKLSLFILVIGLVFRDSMTSNKTYRKGDISCHFENVHQGVCSYNSDYFITENKIYNLKKNTIINYVTTSTYPVNDEYKYINTIYEIDLYSDYFVCKLESELYKRINANSATGTSNYKLIEEKIDYSGKNQGIIKDEEVEESIINKYILNPSGGSFDGSDLQNYIYDKGSYSEKPNTIALYNYCYSKKGKTTCLNLEGNTLKIDKYVYFSNHVYKKRNDSRYIGLSGLYRLDTETKEIITIKEFYGKRIIAFNDEKILYLDYKTVYKYDLKTNKKEKVVKLCNYKDIDVYTFNGKVVIEVYSKNKQYFVSEEYNFIAVFNIQ